MFFIVFFVFFCFLSTVYGSTLFSSSATNYEIVVSRQASKSEKTAAQEFARYLRDISRATFPIVHTPSADRHHIFVGYDKVSPETGEPFAPEDDSFTYYTVGDDLHILGGSERGTMYGVFSFLEQQLGVHWYTPDYTHLPSIATYTLPVLNHTEHPAIGYRNDFYYTSINTAEWRAHNRLNENMAIQGDRYGRTHSYWGIHTLGSFITASRYFRSHPEYFSLVKGKRIDKGQLCLTNPDVLSIVTDTIRKIMRQKPQYWVYDVSQNDNDNCCECADCKRIEQRYGGHSGLVLWFTNQVADAVRDEFPDKYIGTFAYRYTRQAPKDIVPASNVVIRLCNIECCFSHPLDGCPENRSFVKDYDDWMRLTDRIYIWDYVTIFRAYLCPFPNFGVLAPNIRFFRDRGCLGIFEEGQHQSNWGEFSELRQWILSRLLWDPDQNTDELARQFICDYYGPAASLVQRYYDSLQRLVRPDVHFKLRTGVEYPLFTDKFIQQSISTLERATRLVGNDSIHLARVNRQLACVYYLKIEHERERSILDGTVSRFADILTEDSTLISEWFTLTPQAYFRQIGYE